MIGVYGQGITETLFGKDTVSKSLCQLELDAEMAKIREIEDMRASESVEGFSVHSSGSRLDDRREAATAKFAACNAAFAAASARNMQADADASLLRQEREAAARASVQADMAVQAASDFRQKLWWILPLVALVPLAYLFFRRKRT